MTRMAYGNGTSQLWDFDNRKRISRIRIATPAPVSYIEDLNYTIDGAGNITSINENSYSYDGFHRIVGAETKLPEIPDHRAVVEEHFGTYSGGDPVEGKVYDPAADLFPQGAADGRINGQDYLQALVDLEGATAEGTLPFDRESFSYDRNGNRVKLVQNGDEYTYSYGIRNRLEKIERKKEGSLTREIYAEYGYDENGNTVSRTIYGEEGTETVTFEYDVLNRLVKTVLGTEFTEYFYDNAGNRVIKASSDGSLDLYLRHGTIAVAMDMEINGDQSSEKGRINRYVLSGDLVAGRVTTIVAADDSTTVEKSYYHLDHLNSTKVVTDESGEVVVNYTYRAFGEQLKRLDRSDNPVEDLGKYSYSGKELDEDIGLYYFNARFYDAATGRFINLDPIQDGSNWYVYCSNNPINMIDPTGLSATTIGAISGAIGGAIKSTIIEITDINQGVSVKRIVASTAIGLVKGAAVGLVVDTTIAAAAAVISTGGSTTPVAAAGVIATGAAASAAVGFVTGSIGSVLEQNMYGEVEPSQVLKDGGLDAAFAAGGTVLAGSGSAVKGVAATYARYAKNASACGIATGGSVNYGSAANSAGNVAAGLSGAGDIATVAGSSVGSADAAIENHNGEDEKVEDE